MVTSSDILFWTSLEVSEEDASRYFSSVLPLFLADGGNALSGDTRTQALCYLIASRIVNRNGTAGKISESLGGYSYTRKAPSSSSYWMDLYHEVMSGILHMSALLDDGPVKRVDTRVVQMNRRYRNGGIL